MYLLRLELQNYRGFPEGSFNLPQHGLTLVAGQNNSGKSALLSAIDVLAGRHPAIAVRFHGATGRARLVADFVPSDDERLLLFGNGPHAEAWAAETSVFSVLRCELEQDEQGGMLASRVSTANRRGELQAFGVASGLGASPTASMFNPATLASSAPSDAADQFPPQETWGSVTGGGWLQAWSGTPNLPSLISEWGGNVFHFSAIRTGTPRRAPTHDIGPTLQPDGGNLAQCLLFHFSQDSGEWHAIRRLLGQILPDIGELVVPAAGNEVEVAFVDPDSGERRNLKDLGAGVEQLLMTAYVGVTQPTGSMILMEEPETSLHPAAQRELLRHLLGFATNRAVVATTHSPVFLDETADPQRQVLLVRRAYGRSDVATAEPQLRDVLGEIGVRLSDVISAERVLLVEGESDADILRAWFSDLLLGRHAAVVAMSGGDQAYHVDMVQHVVEQSDSIGRQMLFMRDRDELGERRLTQLASNTRVAVLARRELENYFLDDPAAVWTALCARADQPPFAAHELADELRQAADSLRPVVILKRVVEDSVPARLLDRRAVENLVRQGPTLSALSDAVADSLQRASAAQADLAAAWSRVSDELEAVWESDWRQLAPGADVLSLVWKRSGLAYDKKRDGARVAAAMKESPDEIRAVIARFLSDDSPPD